MRRPLSKLFPAIMAMVISAIAGAEPPSHALQKIKRMTGCFEVTYRFAEDGEHDIFNPEVGVGPVTEWIQLIRGDNGDLTFVHVGLAKGKAFPHFEETWSYSEGTTFGSMKCLEEAALWRRKSFDTPVVGLGRAMFGNVMPGVSTSHSGVPVEIMA